MLCIFPRYCVPWCLCCAVACASAATTTELPEIRHVLFVLVDDLGWADVGYHGKNVNSSVDTPTIDALSAQGVRLGNYYVNQLCSPTRTSLLSGRYAYTISTNVGVTDGAPAHMPRSVSTIANRLQDAGWATAIFGKWDAGYTYWGCTPNCRGFDHFYGFYGSSNDYFTHKIGMGLDFKNDTETVWNRDGVYFDEDIAQEHIRWIREIHRQHPHRKTFAYHAHQAVHAPLQVPEHYIRGSCLKIPDSHPARRIMCGMMNMVDDSLANLTMAYKDLGLWHKTVLIFSSDNGGNNDQGGNNYPLRGSKGTTFEGGIRSVAFVAGGWPGVQRHTSSHAMMHVSDWYPTIVEGIAGLQVNIEADGYPGLDGISAWSAITEGSPSNRKEMLLNLDPTGHFAANGAIMNVPGQGAIRLGKWKLLHGFTGVWSQYTDTYGGGSCTSRDGHVPKLLNTTLPMTESTSSPFCPAGWVPPPESNLEPIPPPDGDGVSCQGRVPCTFVDSSLIMGGTLLFNIEADPHEKHNVALEHPDKVIELLARLQSYNLTNIWQQHPPKDSDASVENHHGVHNPWRGDPDPKACGWEDLSAAMQMKASVSEGQTRDRKRKQGRADGQTKQIEPESDAETFKNAQKSLEANTAARDWSSESDVLDTVWRLLSWWTLSVSGVGVSFIAGPVSFSTSQVSSVLPSWCSWF